MEPIEFWVFGGEGVEGREENGFSNYFLFKKDKTRLFTLDIFSDIFFFFCYCAIYLLSLITYLLPDCFDAHSALSLFQGIGFVLLLLMLSFRNIGL